MLREPKNQISYKILVQYAVYFWEILSLSLSPIWGICCLFGLYLSISFRPRMGMKRTNGQDIGPAYCLSKRITQVTLWVTRIGDKDWEPLLRLSLVWTKWLCPQNVHVGILNPYESSSALTSGFSVSRTMRSRCLLSKPPSSWYLLYHPQ